MQPGEIARERRHVARPAAGREVVAERQPRPAPVVVEALHAGRLTPECGTTRAQAGNARRMADDTFHEQLTKYLTDAHSIEVQALEQMKRAPGLAGDPGLAEIFTMHERETREHERLVREALEQRDASPSTLKDAAGRLGAWGMVLFAKLNPDTPGKLAMHAYSYEHMELAAYELLRRIAERGGDEPVRDLAARIGAQERAMAQRIGEHWDAAVEASLREKDAEDVREEVVKYLRDAHALEGQALQLLEAGPEIAEFDELRSVFERHVEQTREHQRLVDERLEELGSAPSRVQAAAMRASALNLGGFFKAQPDTPVKLAGFAYAFEALEAGAYELLARTARRAGDQQTVALAERILGDENAAAEQIAGTWDAAVDAALEKQLA
jgi:ferritin-like metal-binding protein YciE